MKPQLLAVLFLPVMVVGAALGWPKTPASIPEPAPARPAALAQAAVPAPPVSSSETIELALAMEKKAIVAEFSGNGRDQLRLIVMNKGTTPLRVTVSLGQLFASDTGATVMLVRPATIEVGPGKTRDRLLATAATRSTNRLAPTAYQLSYASLPALEPLLRKAQEHPELTLATLQTAILALTENLPLSAVAKFTMAASSLPSRFNTDAFRVETLDLLSALTLLREVKVKEEALALTIDPQLKIEAMIDPTARPLAMRYYGIGADYEWEFWRTELINGEPSTRHYALYGIARFYPDVALQMLPRWALETRTNPVYRLAAVQALADTERGEALPLLRQLSRDLGPITELGRAATGAADYLGYQMARNLAARNAVAFRNSSQKHFTVASN